MMKYTEEHEWITLDGDIATVGITKYATEQLGDIVFVELPDIGRAVSKGDGTVVVESVKAASDIYAPLDGEITEVNDALADAPESINADPEGKGWLFKIKVNNADDVNDLLDESAYKALTE